jgi:hypothetical protein
MGSGRCRRCRWRLNSPACAITCAVHVAPLSVLVATPRHGHVAASGVTLAMIGTTSRSCEAANRPALNVQPGTSISLARPKVLARSSEATMRSPAF